MRAKNRNSLADEPFPPGQPKVKDQDRDHITVQWEPPENDGGAPITGYEVERREPKTNRWIKVISHTSKYVSGSLKTAKDKQYCK